jgi:2-oxo-4-hydroxy-4-carboxy--5-ureidoimidazoline (OHCU) decarboxylase
VKQLNFVKRLKKLEQQDRELLNILTAIYQNGFGTVWIIAHHRRRRNKKPLNLEGLSSS